MEESGRKHGLPGNLFLLLTSFPSSPAAEITAAKKPFFVVRFAWFVARSLRNVGRVTSQHTCPSFRNSVRSSDEHATAGVIHVSRLPNKIRNTATSFSRLAIIWDSFVSAGDSMSIFFKFNFGVAGALLEITQHLLSGVWTTLARQVRTRKNKKETETRRGEMHGNNDLMELFPRHSKNVV